MGVPVTSFNDFQAKLKESRKKSVIFGFLLYDSRPSQKVVADFSQAQPEWIDELARSSKIYFFFPFKTTGTGFANPSAEVARLFRIGLSRLPGVLLFVPPGTDGKLRSEHAVYLPLAAEDFGDAEIYEPILIDLFELIRTTLRKTQVPHEVLVLIQAEVKRLRRRTAQRGFADHIRKGAQVMLFEIPRQLIDSIAEGLGKALGGQLAG